MRSIKPVINSFEQQRESIGSLDFFLNNVRLAILPSPSIVNNFPSFDAYVFPEKVHLDISKSSLETLNENTFEIWSTPYVVILYKN